MACGSELISLCAICDSSGWRRVFTTIKFPKEGHVFDYFPDPKTGKMTPWEKVSHSHRLCAPDIPLSLCVLNLFSLRFCCGSDDPQFRRSG
jgi:hypothetical protein